MSYVYPSPNEWLQDDVRDRVESLDKQTCTEWGGVWSNETAHVRPLPLDATHQDQTRVRSAADGLAAFERYIDFFEYVLAEFEPTAESAVLVPCGAMKPIGSSAGHQKKVEALKQAGFVPRCDLHIMSEPCTMIPHDMRLTLPAVNYDFPPKYTEQEQAPEVFDVFTDRLATWIDETEYETIYPYLVARHQNKFDAALDKADHDPRVVEIPGASANVEKLVDEGDAAYSGDQFKSTTDIAAKLDFIRGFKDLGDDSYVANYPSDVRQFYRSRAEYRSV